MEILLYFSKIIFAYTNRTIFETLPSDFYGQLFWASEKDTGIIPPTLISKRLAFH